MEAEGWSPATDSKLEEQRPQQAAAAAVECRAGKLQRALMAMRALP